MNKLEKLLSPFQIDLRSLGLFRILFGLLLLRDLVDRFTHLFDFYSDWGALPRSVLISENSNPYHWSLFNISGSALHSGILLTVLGIFLILFTVGLKTRIATFFSWLILVSLHSRFPLANHGGDDLIRVCLFWCMFLPTNAKFSLDAKLSIPTTTLPNSLVHFASMAFLGQLAYMYIFTGLLKWHPIWHSEGSAIWLAIQLDQFAKPIGVLMRQLPFELTKWMTIGTLWFELIAPVIVFFPWKRNFLRTWIPAAFIAFHFVLFLSFEINLFPWTCMIYWVAFFPESVWRQFPKLEGWLENTIDRAKGLCSLIQPSRPQLRYGYLSTAFILACFGIVTYWNIATLKDNDDYKLTGPIKAIASTLRISQKWTMFAPYPKRYSGWMITDGVLADGSHWDVLNNIPFTEEMPTDVVNSYKDGIWRKYLGNLVGPGNNAYRLHLGKWICRQWNETHDEGSKLQTFQLFYMNERTLRPGETAQGIKKDLLWSHYCFKKP